MNELLQQQRSTDSVSTDSVSTDEVRRRIVRRLGRLIRIPADVVLPVEELFEVLIMFNALPITTDEFGLATNRLRNARRYLLADERGAARYELRMLLGRFQDTDRNGVQSGRERTRRY